jgi:hypothetical protein
VHNICERPEKSTIIVLLTHGAGFTDLRCSYPACFDKARVRDYTQSKNSGSENCLRGRNIMAASSVTREYLEAIYNLLVEGDPVVGVRLAEKFRVSPPNVAQMLKRMEKDGLIRMPGRGRGRPGDGIELTPAGKAEA